MPRNIPQFTKCASPGVAHPMEGGSIAMLVFVSIVGGAVFAGGALTMLTAIAGHIASAGCVIGAGIAGFVTVGILDFKDWYYNQRLMCIQHDQCNCGTIVGAPHDSTDGDRKMDILIAPFQVQETEQLQIQTLIEMGTAGELNAVPDAADLQNRQVRFGYFRGLTDREQANVQLNLVDNHMFNQPGRDFLRHYYRRDAAVMGAAAFNNSPDDTGPNANPMFRVSPLEGGDPEEKQLVPYMHCEVEGDRLARILDNLLAAVIAFLVAFLALCAICDVLSLGALDFLCGPLGAVAAAILALIVWLIANWVNDPDDGKASEIDVDVTDPDFDTPPSEAQQGDVVYLFGDWVMDEHHGNYFEIHPVKAYYLLCRSNVNPDDWEVTEEVPASECAFDVRDLTADDFERICKIVKAVETTDPDDGFTTTIEKGLSMIPAQGR